MMHDGTALDIEELAVLLPSFIFGAEDEDNGSNDDNGSEDNDDAGSDDENSDDDDNGGHDDRNDPKVKGLRDALAAERKRADAAEKKLKAENKAKAERELAEKSDLEQSQTKAEQAIQRAEKLANGLLQRDLNDAIKTAAAKLGFIDASDAIDGVDRTKLDYTQDEDDPTDISIDVKTVEAAVKALATKKPHFIKQGTDDGEPTGSQFGGAKKKKSTTEDDLRKKYPALR